MTLSIIDLTMTVSIRHSALTFSIVNLIVTVCITTLSIMTYSIVDLIVYSQHKTVSIMKLVTSLSVIMVSVTFSYCYAECHYAECHNAECRGAVEVVFFAL